MSGSEDGHVQAGFGSWPSPITPGRVTAASVSFTGIVADTDRLYWSELRPAEGGRVQIVAKGMDEPPGEAVDLLPEGFSARTRVHEYGGGAWWVADGLVVFSNWDDQRVWAVEVGSAHPPWPLTAAPTAANADRFADLRLERLADGSRWVFAVRERHAPGQADSGRAPTRPVNEIVAVPVVERGRPPSEPTLVVAGPDFVSHPRLAPDRSSMCWLAWNDPNLPWDSNELNVGLLDVDGAPRCARVHRVAGGDGVSIAQPRWDPDGRLWFVSDRAGPVDDGDGWWGLWRFESPGAPGPEDDPVPVLVRGGSELAQPQWIFGQSWYDFSGAALAVCARSEGRDHFEVWPRSLEQTGSRRAPLAAALGDVTSIDLVTATGRGVAMVAAGFDREPAIIEVDCDDPTADPVVHRAARDLDLDRSWWSVPEHVTVSPFGAADPDVHTHALVYPPTNPGVVAPPGTLPPLLVMIHGGPTGAARPVLSLAVQFWTSRGFCVADVNYRGSTGYGRRYRRALDGAWGVADVEDCIAVAEHLVVTGTVDPDRCVIRGGSAGGFTALNALIAGDVFRAGACLYGVTDLEALAADTHKFEARYTDSLVGPWPEAAGVYRERSPINRLDRLRTPLIVFHGLEDQVVPLSQAETLVEALDAHGIPHAYLTFAGEQHGFRRAETIERVLEAELYFYGRVLGFEPGDDLQQDRTASVEVRHLA